jgi:hypothetical protein
MEVDGSGSSHFPSSHYATVVFEPYTNGGAGATTWKRYNVLKGMVWLSQPIDGHTSECTISNLCTYQRLLELNPDARILTMKMRVGQNSGGAWTGFEGYVDDITVGFGTATEYDLGN